MSNLPAHVTRMEALRQTLTQWVDMMPGVLPYNQTKDRIIDVFTLAVQEIPLLKKCAESDRGKMSIIRAVLGAARYGFEIGGQLGHAWVIPFKDKRTGEYYAQLIIGFQGYISLAYRHPLVASIETEVIRDGDTFDFMLGTRGYIDFKPKGDPYAKPQHAYCVIKTMRGGEIRKVMSVKEIETFRARSKARDSGPWVTDWEAMAMKTVFMRAAKYAPKTDDLAKALQYDQLAMREDAGLVTDITVEATHPEDPDKKPPKTKSERLADEGDVEQNAAEENEPIDAEFEVEEPSDDLPVDIKAIEITAKIQHEFKARNIGEELFTKWVKLVGLDDNKELQVQEPEKLQKLLDRCLVFE